MIRILAIAFVTAALFAMSGCKAVTSGMATDPSLSGEAWYVRTTTFLSLPVGTHIYFCPKQMGKGPAKCTEAIVHEASGAAAPAADMSGGFGAPPPQPGYGQPAAPGGFGQPAAPGGYGQPPAGGYGQPPTGGYAPTPSPTPSPSPGTPQPPTPGY